MSDLRENNHEQELNHPRSPVIRNILRDRDDDLTKVDREFIVDERIELAINDYDVDVTKIDRQHYVNERRERADIRLESDRPQTVLRDRLDNTMTRITDFYRRDKTLNADSQRKAGHRVFRLKGYTTVGKINRKFKQERQQRALRNILTTLMIILLLIILFVIYNPFKDMSEFRKISGEDSLYKNRTTTTATVDETTNSSVNP